MSETVVFDEKGLVPCVAQDWSTGEVLTLAYMNAEALRLTLETREVHFYSRSRQRLWRKGETSGNVMRLRRLRYDCDADALLALVEPAGPACHTGERTCFYRDLEGERELAPHEALAALERTRASARGASARRAPTPSSCSPTPTGSARRSARRPTRSPVPRPASPTSASPRRRPTSSTTSSADASRATCRSPPRSRSSMSVAAERERAGLEPDLDRPASSLARRT